jgi:peptidyl-prolyl cis-trans isomerase SurA
MKTLFRFRRSALVVAVLALAVATARAEIIERVLVKVNGDILTQTDLETRQSAMIRQRRENPQTMSNEQLSRTLAEITPQVIVDAVDELLLLQRGRELGYKLSEERFKQILDNIKKENKLETEEQFQAALKAEGMTLADLRKQLEKSMVIQQVQSNEVLGRIAITETEGKAYYEAHKNEFTSPATLMLREVLVSVPTSKGQTVNVAQDESAKAKAEALLARAKAGENFEKIVADSSDAASKGNGGLIGPISLGDLEPKLRAIFEALKQGDVSPVVRTTAGYQFFKVETLNPATVQPWDKVKEEVGNKVAQSKQSVEFAKYMQRLRAQAVIEWKNAELKKMFDQRTADEGVPSAPTTAAPKKDATPAKKDAAPEKKDAAPEKKDPSPIKK